MSVLAALQSVLDTSRLAREESRTAEVTATASVESRPADTIELGTAARQAVATSEQERIVEIRAQIAAGTYLTEDKLDFVANRLQAVLQDHPTDRKALSA